MKKTLLSVLLGLAALAAPARGLLITTTGGVEVYFPFTDTGRPVMRFVNSQVWVEGRHYQFGEIAEFRLVDADPTGIRLPETARLDGGTLVLRTADPVTVSDLSGKVQQVAVSQADGQQVVDVSRLPRGTYAVKAGKARFKFVRK